MKNTVPKKLITISAVLAAMIILAFMLADRSKNRSLRRDVFLVADPNTKAVLKQKPKTITQTLLKTLATQQKYLPITIDYPFDKSVFPPEIVAPSFLWHDPHQASNTWLINITFQDNPNHIYVLTGGDRDEPKIDPNAISPTNAHYRPSDYDLAAKAWSPDENLWNIIKQHSVEKYATLTIVGFNSSDSSKVLSKASIQLMTSKDPVGAPIFYRDVPLMPSETKDGVIKPLAKIAFPLITWRLRDISKPSAPVVLKDVPTCANCHSFSRDGKTLGMDMDGPGGDKGAYAFTTVRKDIVITNDDIITWNSFKYKPKGHKTIGFFSQVSPDGQYVVSTVNESVFVTNYTDFKFLQSFYPTRGILAVYSKATGTMEPLPGGDDPNYVNANGCWSPDSQYIVFSRAPATDNYISDERPTYAGDPKETPIQYDLYRIPFNNGSGGTPEPIEGASNNGMSNSFPKYSPDGKWIVFVQSERGQLMRPDSKLYIIPARGGKARKMNCNLSLMNSWHSWSPNSRWLVFSSKGFSPFTQMFLTHIDENGNDTPPVLIPNSTAANRAVNIPEFLNNEPEAIVSISAPAQESLRHFKKGVKLMRLGKYGQALAAYEKSLQLNPYYHKSYTNIANLLLLMGKTDQAIANYYKALDLEPDDVKAHDNLAGILMHQGNFSQAIRHFAEALRIEPNTPDLHAQLMSALARQEKLFLQSGKLDQAVTEYQKVLQLLPDDPDIHNDLGTTLGRQGKLDEAATHFKRALEIKPDLIEAHTNLGYTLARQRKFDNAIIHLTKALQLDPNSAAAHYHLAKALTEKGKISEALTHFDRALQLRPDWITPMSRLAWLLATHKEAKFRNPQKAIRLAEQACKLTDYENASLLDILAAAYAQAEHFDKAQQTAQKAVELASSAGQTTLARSIDSRLQLYKADKKFHQGINAAKSPPGQDSKPDETDDLPADKQ